jgi:type IV secretion system protein VirB6
MACPPLVPEAGFVRSMMGFVDCQAATLGAGGYQALAAPGSTLGLVLTGFMTLFVAFFGYRLLLGQGPDLRSGMLAFARIAIVLALATSWPAYRVLVYDVALRGPAELATEIGAPSSLPGAGGGLVERLDVADQAMVALAILGEGRPPVPAAADANQVAQATQTVPQPYPGFNTFAIGGARMIFLIGAIGGLAAVRMIAGLLLAIGPLFVAFLLFENTRSLFEGWLRVLAGAALAAFGTAIALGAELALIEPWLTDLLARRGADQWLPAMPTELLVVTTVFAIIIVAMLYAAARIAWAFRLAPVWHAGSSRIDMMRGEERVATANAGAVAASAPAADRSRAATVVDAVAASQRREAGQAPAAAYSAGRGDPAGPGGRPQAHAGRPHDPSEPLAPTPLGQSFPRRTRGRVSASAGRRDRRS